MAQNFNSSNPETGVTTFGTLYSVLRDHQDAIRSCFSGTAFPNNPLPGQPCFRTDRNTDYGGALYYYSGDPTIGEAGWVDEAHASLLYNALETEVHNARGSAASLDARLDVALNEDGTLKSSAPAGSWWMTEADAVTYVDATSFTVAGDKTAIYVPGRAVHLIQTTTDYGYVDNATYDAVALTTTVVVYDTTVDTGLTGVEYGQPVNNDPYGAGVAKGLATLDATGKVVQDPANAQTTSADGKIPIAGANGLDQSWIENIFESQQAINLVKNGLFYSWSSGTSSTPDSWAVYGGESVAKGNDGDIWIASTAYALDDTCIATTFNGYAYKCTTAGTSGTVEPTRPTTLGATVTDGTVVWMCISAVGSNYATITSDGFGTTAAGLHQGYAVSPIMANWFEICKALKLTVTVSAKVRTTSTNVKLYSPDRSSAVAHTGSSEWETLSLSHTFDGTETEFTCAVYITAADNISVQTFDIAECSFTIGSLALPYQENPLDRALQAVHYQDTTPTNYEYRGLRIETGIVAFVSDGTPIYITNTVTFQKPFRTFLLGVANPKDSGSYVVSTTSSGTTTSMVTSIQKVDNTAIAAGSYYANWIAIGVD